MAGVETTAPDLQPLPLFTAALAVSGAHMHSLTGLVVALRLLQLRDIRLGQLWPVDLDRELLELRRQLERRRIVCVVNSGQARWPSVERPGLAGREGRRVVILAEPRGGVSVVTQDPPDGRLVPGDDAVVAGNPVACSEITPNRTE